MMAFLLADENDISIKVVTFAGKDKTKLIKRNEYGGTCLVTAIDKVLDYMESINETMVTMGNHRRTEEKLFDMASFKEAWQNACIHTKWDKGNVHLLTGSGDIAYAALVRQSIISYS